MAMPWLTLLILAVLLLPPAVARGAEQVGTTFPADFPVILDASLGVPVIGFGAAGASRARRSSSCTATTTRRSRRAATRSATSTASRSSSPITAMRTSELWGLGYQGDQCDLRGRHHRRSLGRAHSTVANVPDLRRFVHAVLALHGRERGRHRRPQPGRHARARVDAQDHAFHLVRRFVAIDGPNHGIINCSPSPLNYYQLPAFGGFTPESAVCQELGSPDTPFLRR